MMMVSVWMFANSSLQRLSSYCQLSSQNQARFPFLISQKLWFWTRALFSHALFQIAEPLICPIILISFSSCHSLAYLCFQRFAQGDCISFSHPHQILAPRTLFRIPGSWRPKPPWDLGLHTLSHATRAHFFFSSPFPQRKYLLMFLILVTTLVGAGMVVAYR